MSNTWQDLRKACERALILSVPNDWIIQVPIDDLQCDVPDVPPASHELNIMDTVDADASLLNRTAVWSPSTSAPSAG